MIFEKPQFAPCGDHFLLIQFGDDASIELNFIALGVSAALKEGTIEGIIDTNPSYNSLVVEYDFEKIAITDLQNELEGIINNLGSIEELELKSRLAYLPVNYLDPWTKECIADYNDKITAREYDPDFVARINGMADSSELVRVHSATEHWVVAVCSTPGLPLMRALDPRCNITSPKYNPPRTWTTLGGIGVGGLSTSIYTTPGPGGYNLIGRTPVPLWDPKQIHRIFKDRVVLLKEADRVKFVPISTDEFRHIEEKLAKGTYEFNITDYQTFSVGAYKKWKNSLEVDLGL